MWLGGVGAVGLLQVNPAEAEKGKGAETMSYHDLFAGGIMFRIGVGGNDGAPEVDRQRPSCQL